MRFGKFVSNRCKRGVDNAGGTRFTARLAWQLMARFCGPPRPRQPFLRFNSLRWLTVAALLFLVPGCTSISEYVHNGCKVGPNYGRPPAPVEQDWIDAADQRLREDDTQHRAVVDGLQRPGPQRTGAERLPAESHAAGSRLSRARGSRPAGHRRRRVLSRRLSSTTATLPAMA